MQVTHFFWIISLSNSVFFPFSNFLPSTCYSQIFITLQENANDKKVCEQGRVANATCNDDRHHLINS